MTMPCDRLPAADRPSVALRRCGAALAARASCALCALLAVAACQGKVLSPTPADQLRRSNAELAMKVDSLERELSEARTALAATEVARASAAQTADRDAATLSPEAIQATPHLARVVIGGTSHTDLALSGGGCVARIYLEPLDGLGRFLQVVGSVSVTLYWSPPGCDAQVISCHDFGPLALRSAYRSGFGGTHYTLEWPVEPEAARAGDATAQSPAWTCGMPLHAKIEYSDARSGRVFTAERTLAAIAVRAGGAH